MNDWSDGLLQGIGARPRPYPNRLSGALNIFWLERLRTDVKGLSLVGELRNTLAEVTRYLPSHQSENHPSDPAVAIDRSFSLT